MMSITSAVELLTHFEHKTLRPFLLRTLSPSQFVAWYSLNRHWFLQTLQYCRPQVERSPYPVTLFKNNLFFPHDMGNAAGLDKDGKLLEFNYHLGAGFSVVGTVLSRPHTGNLFSMWGKKTNPWTPLPGSHASLNSLGLPSIGIDKVLENIKKFQDAYPDRMFPIGLSLMGHPLDEGQAKLDGLLTALEKSLAVVDFIEINESCPNVQQSDGTITRLQEIIKLRNQKNYVPVLVKLANIGDASYTVKIFDQLGLDGIVAINTQKNYEQILPQVSPSDKTLFRDYIRKFQGGVGGELIRDTALSAIQQLKLSVKEQHSPLVLIHVGGIENAQHIKQSRGLAPLRQWYTGLMQQLGEQDWRKIYL